MILGIGSDIIEIKRIKQLIERFSDKFLSRTFTLVEQERAKSAARPEATYAKRFSAKEACLKALGTGLVESISWQDMEIMNNAAGKPEISLSGGALKILQKLTPDGYFAKIYLSLSDSEGFAHAFVVIEAVAKEKSI